MEELRYLVDGKCPWCRKDHFFDIIPPEEYMVSHFRRDGRHTPESVFYGSPIRQCECGKEYLDMRYHEAAIDGRVDPVSQKKELLDRISMVIGAPLMVFMLLSLFGMKPDAVFCVILLLTVFIAVIFEELTRGSDKKKWENIMSASEERLRDDAYKKRLKEIGVEMPGSYQ